MCYRIMFGILIKVGLVVRKGTRTEQCNRIPADTVWNNFVSLKAKSTLSGNGNDAVQLINSHFPSRYSSLASTV